MLTARPASVSSIRTLLSLHQLSGGRRSTVIPSATHEQLGRSFPLVCEVGLGGTSRINGSQVLATRLECSETDDGTVSAEGIELETADGSLKRLITARREIVLSCGTLRTPQLLLLRSVYLLYFGEKLTTLSGIGPAAHLHERGIRVVRDTQQLARI